MKLEMIRDNTKTEHLVSFGELCDGQVFECPERQKRYVKIVNHGDATYNCICLDNFVLTGFSYEAKVRRCKATLVWELE